MAPVSPLSAAAATLPALTKQLVSLPMDGRAGTRINLPVGGGASSVFEVRDSRTLPRTLATKFPGLRSFRGTDAAGRTLRLDLSAGGVRMSVREGPREWTVRARTPAEWSAAVASAPDVAPFAAEAASHPRATGGSANLPGSAREAASAANGGTSRSRRSADLSTSRGGAIRYDFRLAVAASSRYAAKFGGSVGGTLAEVVHAVNRVNEVFESDLGVHFTLVANNDRLIRDDPTRDPFRREDPGPAAVRLIDREIGARNYDLGHALTHYVGGESAVGTSCSDARDADFFATHKAAAWSGHAQPDTSPDAIRFMIHVLGRQLGAWPTANGCTRSTLDDRAFEPGSGSTIMGHAPAGCGSDQSLQAHGDLYFHAANIAQMQDWLASRGGQCAMKRINPASAPWIDPASLAEEAVIPARTPFTLEARAEPVMPDRHLTYAWEQMDAGTQQRGALLDRGDGPLFRSFPPSPSGRRVFPRMAAVLGHERPAPGEVLPETSRFLNFRVTVRDNGNDTSTLAHADTRVRVIDTGRPFAVQGTEPSARATAGEPLTIRWDIADTDRAPIDCHFVDIDLSIDGGDTWIVPAIATDEPNDGEARPILPTGTASERARMRVRCDWRPFFAVSPQDFDITPATDKTRGDRPTERIRADGAL